MSSKKKARVSPNFFGKLPFDCVHGIGDFLTIEELQLIQMIFLKNISLTLIFQRTIALRFSSIKLENLRLRATIFKLVDTMKKPLFTIFHGWDVAWYKLPRQDIRKFENEVASQTAIAVNALTRAVDNANWATNREYRHQDIDLVNEKGQLFPYEGVDLFKDETEVISESNVIEEEPVAEEDAELLAFARTIPLPR